MRCVLLALVCLISSIASAEQKQAPFPGKLSEWKGFPRYDFQVHGKPVMVVAPAGDAAPGRPWVWHGEFFGHKPAPDIALLKEGYHIVYMSVPNMLGCPQAVSHWNDTYAELTSKYGLAKKVALVGLSRGGLYCYNWAIANPDKVACLYGDAPVCDFKSWPGGKGTGKGSPRDWQRVLELWKFKDDTEALAYSGNPVDNLEPLAKAKVPLLHVFGDADDVVPWEENTKLIAKRYQALGGEIELIRKPGVGHHPHGLEDSTPIIEFIKKHTSPNRMGAAAFQSRQDAARALVSGLEPLVKIWTGQQSRYAVSAKITLEIDGKPQTVEAELISYGEDSYDVSLTHADYSAALRRRADATALALPHHRVVFHGQGETDNSDHLQARGILQRLVSVDSAHRNILLLQPVQEFDILATLLGTWLQPEVDTETGDLLIRGTRCAFSEDGQSIKVSHKETSVQITFAEVKKPQPATDWGDMQLVSKDRAEIERTVTRGLRRISEIFAPGKTLTAPVQVNRTVSYGELRWIQGQRVCLLRGTPEQIGQAHGELLTKEATHCVDSVLYAFGLVNTIRTGKWFRDELQTAFARLAPHIPERHQQETIALAQSLGVEPELAQALNVFPELFHCSGFAVFDSATTDGTLYHGRVLDYMTTIGLQDAATTFIVQPDGYLPFANVGYAAFIGSVSGMNAEGISLGEMGGGGEGQWDGVPMATLMRRALEECRTLPEVQELWRTSPRTCEYYYVFADGNTNDAVGVGALPESIEFILPGQSHSRLGDGIPDTVVLSAGSRLETLRARVKEKHGQIDAATALWLMSRPVAMKSNLHNVLFVPAKGVLYVANASHKKPAAETEYVELNLRELLTIAISD